MRLGLHYILGWVALFMVCGCQSSPAPTKQKAVDKKNQEAINKAKAELAIGRSMAGRLLQFYGIYQDRALLGYVNQVGSYVARYSDFPDRNYMFEIIDTEEVNAFACPGGYILVSLGAMKHAKNEAELAHLLGHEIAHVGLQHMINKLSSMSDEEIKKREAEQERLMSPALRARKRPEVEDSAMGELFARYITGGSGLSIVIGAKMGMSLILEEGLGADLEHEADREGMNYAANAGYQPDAMVDFLCRLEKKRKGPGANCRRSQKGKQKPETVLDKTHPPMPKRIQEIEQQIAKLNLEGSLGAMGTERFRRYTKELGPSDTLEKP